YFSFSFFFFFYFPDVKESQ
ncbi:hypothetical protein ACN42_g11530, partial [Penicillium freii]